LKPARANSSRDPISKKKKNPTQKRASGMAHGVGPEFKPQYHKKKNKKIVYTGTFFFFAPVTQVHFMLCAFYGNKVQFYSDYIIERDETYAIKVNLT
jgi:hypothetical protein